MGVIIWYVNLDMNDSQINSIEEIKDFLNSSEKFEFKKEKRGETYGWIEETLVKFGYLTLGKYEKGIVRKYIEKVTGYSRAQVTRLVGKYRKTGYVRLKEHERHKFKKVYLGEDLQLLAQTDELHDFPNGAALKKILERAAYVYGQKEYENIAQVSVAHIYNLRDSPFYRRVTKRYKKTKPTVANIGIRKKPKPNGVPGYLDVDTAHQGDSEKEKGVYHINTVCEVTQFEFVGAAERISEHYLEPMLVVLIESYPFPILGFHVDNGSEFINYLVANLLNKMLIELTKGRPRHPNDNPLVESKHGSVVRKWIGYSFIRQKHAERLNQFYFGCFNEYLNFHRPCAFATEVEDKKGKVKKIYKPKDYMTPYEKLKSLPNAKAYLKEGVTFDMLNKIAKSKTDNEMAKIVQAERMKLFDEIIPAYNSH